MDFWRWQTLNNEHKLSNNSISNDLNFMEDLSIYPPYIVDLDLVDFADTTIYILFGELDD